MVIAVSDFKYAGRVVRKSPWFTLLTVLMIAGGLAISIYTFAIVNTMVYKDLPVADGHSIIRISGERDGRPAQLGAYEFSEIRNELSRLADIGVYRNARAFFGSEDSTHSVRLTRTEWNIFEFSRTPPLAGRSFLPDDNQEGAEPVAVIGHRIWQSVFFGDPDIVGETAILDGEAIRIVGVMPEEYKFPVNSDLWVPLSSTDIAPTNYSQSTVEAYARLQPGTSAAAANAQLNGLLESIQRQRPEANIETLVVGSISTFQRAQWGEWGPRIFIVLNALAFFVLVLACVNVGNLLLVRTNERVKEIAVRIALGAGRSRLIAQMTLQNILICVTGGSLAFFVASRGLASTDDFLNPLIGNDMPFWWNWSLDSGAALAGGIFLLITIGMVSVLPVHAAFKVSPNTILKESIQGASARSIGRISRILVTVQVALVSAVMLSGGTAAFISYRLASFDSGIDPQDLYITQHVWAGAERDSDEHLQVIERLVSELQSDARVTNVAISQDFGDNAFAVEGVEYNTMADYPTASVSATLDTSLPDPSALLEGRGFDSQDNAGALRTAIVSESLARTYWPGESALGKRLRIIGSAADEGYRVVVGIRRDPEATPLSAVETKFAIYAPLQQLVAPRFAVVMMRYGGNEVQANSAMHQALERSGADMSFVGRVNRYEAEVETLTKLTTTLTNLFVGCGAFAILLAMSGIYGLTSNAVVQRRHEIGLRRAMGATRGNILGLFLIRGGKQLALGLAISAVLSVFLLLLISQLAQLALSELMTMGAVAVSAVSAIVLIAILVAVAGAIREEPNAALRVE